MGGTRRERVHGKAYYPVWPAPADCPNTCGGCPDCECAAIPEESVTVEKIFGATPVDCFNLNYGNGPVDQCYDNSTYGPLPPVPIMAPPAQYDSFTIDLTLGSGFRYFLTRTSDYSDAPKSAIWTGMKINGVWVGGGVKPAFKVDVDSPCGVITGQPCVSVQQPVGSSGWVTECGDNLEDICPSAATGGCIDLTPYLRNGSNAFSLWSSGKTNYADCFTGLAGCGNCINCHQIEIKGNTDIYLWKVDAGVNIGLLCCCVACCEPDGTCDVIDGAACLRHNGAGKPLDSCGAVDCGAPCCVTSGSEAGLCFILLEQDCCVDYGGTWDDEAQTCTGGDATWHGDADNCCDIGCSCGGCSEPQEFGCCTLEPGFLMGTCIDAGGGISTQQIFGEGIGSGSPPDLVDVSACERNNASVGVLTYKEWFSSDTCTGTPSSTTNYDMKLSWYIDAAILYWEVDYYLAGAFQGSVAAGSLLSNHCNSCRCDTRFGEIPADCTGTCTNDADDVDCTEMTFTTVG
jgi:hypothetical protein